LTPSLTSLIACDLKTEEGARKYLAIVAAAQKVSAISDAAFYDDMVNDNAAKFMSRSQHKTAVAAAAAATDEDENENEEEDDDVDVDERSRTKMETATRSAEDTTRPVAWRRASCASSRRARAASDRATE
jgi:hypothetical protein